MMGMVGIEKKAREFLLGQDIYCLRIDLEKLEEVCAALKYRVLSFSAGRGIVGALGLENRKKESGFSAVFKDERVIFYVVQPWP